MVKGDNPLTGPCFVEGAEPGDTLAVKILELDVDGDTGVGAFAPGFGALNETNYTPMLHSALPEKIWFITSITLRIRGRSRRLIRIFR
jgi:acetamidase/formamidase